MANHFTNNLLANAVDLYRYAPGLDADAAPVGDDSAYPTPLALAVRCAVQPGTPERDTDQGRVSGVRLWVLLFRSDYGLAPNDRVVWVDDAGATHKLVVVLTRNLAGRGGAWEVRAEERV